MGVTKPIPAIPLFPQSFRIINPHFTYVISRSYLTSASMISTLVKSSIYKDYCQINDFWPQTPKYDYGQRYTVCKFAESKMSLMEKLINVA